MKYKPHLYILDEAGEPVALRNDEINRWGEWFEMASLAGVRRVALTEISPDLFVSTVFEGLDHNYSWEGPPLLYETMVFQKGDGTVQERTATRAEAEAMHAQVVAYVLEIFGRGVEEDEGEDRENGLDRDGSTRLADVEGDSFPPAGTEPNNGFTIK